MKLLAIYTSLATLEDARRIAEALVTQQLVACAQIHAIESFYQWDGELEHTPEYRLLLKSTETQYSAVEAAIRALHPYTLPAIYAVPVEQAYQPYALWVEANSSPA